MHRLVTVCILAAILAGCDPAVQQPPNPSPDLAHQAVSVRIEAADAEQCDDRCRFIILRFVIRNDGDELICLPSLYQNEDFIHAVIWLTDKSSGTDIAQLAPTDWSSHDPMRSLIEGPHYIIRPRTSREFRVVVMDKFDLRERPANLALRVASFVCSEDGKGGSLKLSDATKDVTFTD